jgi:hypothetical protein
LIKQTPIVNHIPIYIDDRWIVEHEVEIQYTYVCDFCGQEMEYPTVTIEDKHYCSIECSDGKETFRNWHILGDNI